MSLKAYIVGSDDPLITIIFTKRISLFMFLNGKGTHIQMRLQPSDTKKLVFITALNFMQVT